MKKIGWFILFIVILACDKTDENDSLNVIEISELTVTETSVYAQWELVNNADSYQVLFSENSNLMDCIVDEQVSSESNTFSADNLKPIYNYYFKVIAHVGDNLIESETTKIVTGHQKLEVTITTSDNYKLSANVHYCETLISNSSSAVIFMHELGANKGRWYQTDLIDTLTARGYVCLALDFRGHGGSTSIPDLYALSESNILLQNDVKATISYLEENYISPGNTILIGASIGAIAAAGGSSYPNVKGAVAVSAVYDIVLTTFGSNVKPTGVFYLAGSDDKNDDPEFDCGKDAELLYNMTASPRKLKIIQGSSDHGVKLITSESKLEENILKWIDKF